MRILEDIQTGDNADFIHPDKRNRIESGNLGYEDLLKGGKEDTEKIATKSYSSAMEKLHRYIPQNQIPSDPRRFGGLVMGMMRTLDLIKNIENTHVEYLEMLAIDTVLGLPEFSSAKKAVDDGDLIIDAKIVRMMMDMDEIFNKEDSGAEEVEEIESSPDFEQNIMKAMVDVEAEKQKRRFQNVMTQGAASNYMYLFELVRNELNSINPKLADMYGFMQSVGDMTMWITPESISQSGGMPAGGEDVSQDESGAGVIKVRAIIFPLLMHELVKGLMSYINSHGLSQFSDIQSQVENEVNTPENEIYDLLLGKEFWNRLTNAVGENNTQLIMHVWGKISALPAWDADIKGGFAHFIKELNKDPVSARRIVHPFIVDIQKAIDDYNNEEDESGITFENFISSNVISEAITNRMRQLLQQYNANIQKERESSQNLDRNDIASPHFERDPRKQEMTESELNDWAEVDPTGIKGINLPVILSLKKAGIFKTPKDVLRVINETTYVPLKKNEPKKLPVEIPYSKEEQKKFIQQNVNLSFSWVLKQIRDKQIIFPEDLPSIKDGLHFFFKYRDTKKWDDKQPRDLLQYKTASQLYKTTFEMKNKLFVNNANNKLEKIYPGSEIIGIYPDYELEEGQKYKDYYELLRIYPTPQGQQAIYNYVNETGTRLAQWCVAFAGQNGWSHFVYYAQLDKISNDIDPKKLPESIIQNPSYSYYYIAKNGKPYLLFDFQSNYCMDISDSPAQNNEEFQNIIKPLMLKYVQPSRAALDESKITISPADKFLDIINSKPKIVAEMLLYRIYKISEERKADPFEKLNTSLLIKRAINDLLEKLKSRVVSDLHARHSAWENSLSKWGKYINDTKFKQTVKAGKQNNTNIDNIELNTQELMNEMYHLINTSAWKNIDTQASRIVDNVGFVQNVILFYDYMHLEENN